jgi:hypothetical protein
MGLVLTGGLAFASAMGCSSSGGGEGGNGGEVGTGGEIGNGGAGPTTGPNMQTVTTTTTGMIMDISTSCADAPQMTEQMNTLGGFFYEGLDQLNPTDDNDFYLMDMVAGEWYQIITEANADDDPLFIDTVLRLYAPDHTTMVASVDDAYPRISTDSEMVFRATETGTYCLEVLEFAQWVGDPAPAKNGLDYRAVVVPIEFDIYETQNIEVEPNDTAGTATSGLSVAVLQSGQHFTQLAGLLDMAADEDWFEFTAPAGAIAFSVDLTPAGPGGSAVSGFGSTNGPGLIGLYNNASALIGEVDNALQPMGLDGMSSLPVAAAQTYRVRIQRPAAGVGANDFYFLKVFTQDTLNPQELDDTGNNLSGGAEIGVSQPVSPQGVISTFIGGTLTEGDVDWWTFDAPGSPIAGQELSVACSSWAAGSGVRGMEVHYENGAATNNKTQIESQANGVLWSNAPNPGVTDAAVSITEAGVHLIKLENLAATVDSGALAKHYLCGLHVATP